MALKNNKTVIVRTFCISMFSQHAYCRLWHTFCSADLTARAPRQSLPPHYFLHSLPFLLGGLLGEGEASPLILHPPVDSPRVRTLSKMVKKLRQKLQHFTRANSLLLHLLVPQFGQLTCWLLGELQILLNSGWTGLVITLEPERVFRLSFSPLAVILEIEVLA